MAGPEEKDEAGEADERKLAETDVARKGEKRKEKEEKKPPPALGSTALLFYVYVYTRRYIQMSLEPVDRLLCCTPPVFRELFIPILEERERERTRPFYSSREFSLPLLSSYSSFAASHPSSAPIPREPVQRRRRRRRLLHLLSPSERALGMCMYILSIDITHNPIIVSV